MKTSYAIKEEQSEWIVSFSLNGKKRHKNPSKYNWERESNRCLIKSCKNEIHKNKLSGLCADHEYHVADLILHVSKHGKTAIKTLPSHSEIVERLVEWATPRNYPINRFFEELSINMLGNVPDITTLAGKSPLTKYAIPLDELVNTSVIQLVNAHFPTARSTSYQKLKTKAGEFPVRTLAIIFAGLVLCEEANRGDRWFCRNILGKEEKTTQLGGAMPIVYFAARQFPWGVEMKQVLGKILKRW